MSIIIHSPRNSFIKFGSSESEDSCCDSGEQFCIPVIEDDDLVFQFSIITETVAMRNSLWNRDPGEDAKLSLVRSLDPLDEAKSFTVADGLYFDKYITGDKELTYIWRVPLFEFENYISCDQCFYLGLTIHWSDAEDDILLYSNCLIRKCDSCYTSRVEYYGNEDYDEFNYCNIPDVLNRVRLPIHFNQPQFIDDGIIYRKTNGQIKVQKKITTKEYQGTTEFFPEHIHEKLKIALSHDQVYVESNKYTGGIYSTDYKIEWDANMCFAPAAFKATATPYIIRNTNCIDCDTIYTPVECANVTGIYGESSITGEDTWRYSLLGVYWAVAPLANQSFNVFVRNHAGGLFTSVGTYAATPDGNLTASLDIDTSDAAIDIKLVWECGGFGEITVVINSPI